MNHYVFLTDEGYTFEPDKYGKLRERENLQVIGFTEGTNADEAYENLLLENSYLKDTSFERVHCYQLDKDYEQSRKDYDLHQGFDIR